MSRNNNKIVREIVAENLKHMEKPKLCDIVNIIRPFYTYTKEELLEQQLKNKARYIMSQFKDSNKIRTYFLDNSGVYINAEYSTDLADLDRVDTQLSVKYAGLALAINKVRNHFDSVIEKFKRR
jgi:hypothetical protein